MTNTLGLLAGKKSQPATETERMILQPDQIRTDGGTQPRAAIDPAVVKGYREDIEAGLWDWDRHELPVVFYDGKDHWLASGFHRHASVAELGVGLPVEVKQGDRRDAVLFSVGTNRDHGLHRTNADKWRAVETLLRDDEWKQWSNHEIARQCGVVHGFVAKVRAKLEPEADQSERKVQRGGSTYTMSTGNIGGKPAAPPDQDQEVKDSSGLFRPEESGQLSFGHTAVSGADPEPEVQADEPEAGKPEPQAGDISARINESYSYLTDRTSQVIYTPGFPSWQEARNYQIANSFDSTIESGILLSSAYSTFASYTLADLPLDSADPEAAAPDQPAEWPPSVADQEIAAAISAFVNAFNNVWLLEQDIAHYVKRVSLPANSLLLLKLTLPDVKRAIDGQ